MIAFLAKAPGRQERERAPDIGWNRFRLNQSVIELLKNVEAMTPEQRATGEEAFDMVVPAMKVPASSRFFAASPLPSMFFLAKAPGRQERDRAPRT